MADVAEYIGLDLHKRDSLLCILTADGQLVERRIRADPARFAEVLGARSSAHILLEASTDITPWNSSRHGR